MRNRQISDLQQPYHPTQKNEPAPAYTETDSLLPCEVRIKHNRLHLIQIHFTIGKDAVVCL